MDDLLIAPITTLLLSTVVKNNASKERKKRKIWAKKWLLNRDEKSVYGNIIAELRIDDAENSRRYLRMNTATFEVSYYNKFQLFPVLFLYINNKQHSF